jgi:hypothetical protein
MQQGDSAILARKFCDNAFISTPYALLTTAAEGASRDGHESTHLRADLTLTIVRIHPDLGSLMADERPPRI